MDAPLIRPADIPGVLRDVHEQIFVMISSGDVYILMIHISGREEK